MKHLKTSEEDRTEWRQILNGIKGYRSVWSRLTPGESGCSPDLIQTKTMVSAASPTITVHLNEEIAAKAGK